MRFRGGGDSDFFGGLGFGSGSESRFFCGSGLGLGLELCRRHHPGFLRSRRLDRRFRLGVFLGFSFCRSGDPGIFGDFGLGGGFEFRFRRGFRPRVLCGRDPGLLRILGSCFGFRLCCGGKPSSLCGGGFCGGPDLGTIIRFRLDRLVRGAGIHMAFRSI